MAAAALAVGSTSVDGTEQAVDSAAAGSGRPWREPAAFGAWFAELLAAELEDRRRNGLADAPLRRYYAAMLDGHGRPMPIATNAYARRLQPLVDVLEASPRPLRIVDAGSGNGTESYLMGLMGHRVTGVELVEERAAVARSRRAFFERRAGRRLGVTFETANIFRYLQAPGDVDLIWVMEAISHIHPPDRFFDLARRVLGDNGRLLISDPNARNPVALWRSVSLRGSVRRRPHTRHLDPETGRPVEYAEEHITSPRALARALSQSGFSVQRVDVSGFMATTLLPRRLLAMPAVQRAVTGLAGAAPHLPVLRSLGSVFTLVAAPEP